jgi:hypothetical protein
MKIYESITAFGFISTIIAVIFEVGFGVQSFCPWSNEMPMKRIILLTFMIILLVGCTSDLQTPFPSVTATVQAGEVHPTPQISTWSVYDPDPDHLWNRVFRQFYRRVALNGEEYGSDELDPLLWQDTTYLLDGVSYQQAVQVLDEFLSMHAENLIREPLKRAMFQRDLWAVYDWLAGQAEPFPVQRQVLETRLVQVIKRVVLSKDEILSLPDNYGLAVGSNAFPASAQADHPETAFLPSDIFQADDAWVPMGREGGPIAITHTEAFPFYGHSVFLVFLRSPSGRAATLDFIKSLNTEPKPATAIGSEVALVRRMLLIDEQGDLILSPLVETVQIRHFRPAQSFHEFELNRTRLFDGLAGGLVLKTELFMLFMSHGDVFQNPDISELQAAIPDICQACHSEYPPIFNSGNTQSILSYSREKFPLADNGQPILSPTTWTAEAQTVITWKRDHETWKSFKTLWDQAGP